MSLRLISADKLGPVLRELDDPSNLRNHAVQRIIDEGLLAVRSPFEGGVTLEEEVLLPPCVRLGVAVRIVEIYEGISNRIICYDSFDHEIYLGIEMGYVPIEAIRPEGIFWEQIIPSFVALGYSSTTT